MYGRCVLFAGTMACLGCACNHCNIVDEAVIQKAYSIGENRLAEERGYGVCIRIDARSLKWKGESLALLEFEEQLKNEIVQESMSPEEVSRAPFSVVVCENVPYGRVSAVLEVGERLGFVVKSVSYVGRSRCRTFKSDRYCSLPHSDGDMLSMGVSPIGSKTSCIAMHSCGDVLVDGMKVDSSNEEHLAAAVARSLAKQDDYGDKTVVLFIDADVAYSEVASLIDVISKCGCFLVHLASINDRKGLKFMSIGVVAPDDFFWGLSDDV